MAYYLHHYFDPEFNHRKLRPKEGGDGSTDARYLGYVQNVVAGQVLAELVDADDIPDRLGVTRPDKRYVFETRDLPVGPNCEVHPEYANLVIASANGYCFYHDGLITVKKLLNVRSNVGFHTGNIFFVNDLAVHGDVQTGFSLQARDILIKGHVESSKIKAGGDLVCLGGVAGASMYGLDAAQDAPQQDDEDTGLSSGLLSARGNMRLAFCSHTQLRARKDIIIDGSCLHSTLYAGSNLIIKDRLYGGTVYAGKLVYVQEQLGSHLSGPTRIYLGDKPFLVLALQKIDSQIGYLEDKADFFGRQCARNDIMEQEYKPRFNLASLKLEIARNNRAALVSELEESAENPEKCRVVVPGVVMPGCEINIAGAKYTVMEEMRNKTFRLKEDTIHVEENKTVLMDQPPQNFPDFDDPEHPLSYADDTAD